MTESAHDAGATHDGLRAVQGGGGQAAEAFVGDVPHEARADQTHRRARGDAAAARSADDAQGELLLAGAAVALVDAAAGEEAERPERARTVAVAARVLRGHAVVDHRSVRAGVERVPRGDVVAAAATGRAGDAAVADLQRQAAGRKAGKEWEKSQDGHGSSFGRGCPWRILAKNPDFVNETGESGILKVLQGDA